jgi:AcrR family transcriptional regulator
MSAVPLREARQAVVRDRVLDGVAKLLAQGEDLTYARVAAAAGVPERTVYRYFRTRQDLMTAVVAWVNERTGRPRGTTRDEAIELVRQLFPIFDEVAPVVREVLMAPEGLAARLDDNDERRAAARAVVDREVPGLDDDTARRLAAVVQVLTSAATWQTLRDYWDMDGAEAAETVAVALTMLFAGGAR